MEQLVYQEIFYTSSEEGIFSGNAGFGVRTCTKGMDSNDVDKIVEACATGYSVYNERVLDMDRIMSNPDIVYEYPPVYIFKTVDLNDGSKKYVFGRTVYLGIDYGFFKGINAYNRTGTNFLTHLLIFSEKPTVTIIRNLLVNSFYLPANYSCTPDNNELKELLTGSPDFLTEKSYESDENPVLEDGDIDYSPFIMGVVQMLKNRQLPSEMDVPKKMYIKCPWRNVETLLKALEIFPQNLLDNFQYITNYMHGYGIPDGYDMAFVNEFNETELYEDNYITVDLFSRTFKNVTPNIILTNIGDLIRQHDALMVSNLIRFFLDLKDVHESEYDFYYNIFLWTVSDMDIKLSDLTESTLKKLQSVQLDQDLSSNFWVKINKTLNNGLTSTHGREFLLAADKIHLLNSYYPDKIQIKEECINYVTNILFNGRGNFGKIAKGENITTLLQLVNKNLIPSEDLFLVSLKECASENVWEESLSFFYDGHYEGNEKILLAILDSDLSESEIGKLLSSLYPLPNAADSLFDFFKNYPLSIKRAQSTVLSLVNFFGEKRYSDFVWLSYLSQELKQLLIPIIFNHYKKEVESNVKSGINALLDFIEKVGVDQLTILDLWPIIKAASKSYVNESIDDIKLFLFRLNEMQVPYHEYINGETRCLIKLVNQEVPTIVDALFMNAAINNYPDKKQYITSVFSTWMTSGILEDELKSFIVNNKTKLKDSTIDSFVNIIWNHKSPTVRNSRNELVLAIIDNCGWDSNKIKEYGSQCENIELKEFLLKSNKLIVKITRRLFK